MAGKGCEDVQNSAGDNNPSASQVLTKEAFSFANGSNVAVNIERIPKLEKILHRHPPLPEYKLSAKLARLGRKIIKKQKRALKMAGSVCSKRDVSPADGEQKKKVCSSLSANLPALETVKSVKSEEEVGSSSESEVPDFCQPAVQCLKTVQVKASTSSRSPSSFYVSSTSALSSEEQSRVVDNNLNGGDK